MGTIQNHCTQIERTWNQAQSSFEKSPTIAKIRSHCEQVERSFDKSCNKVGSFLDHSPTVFKIAIVATHFFRAIAVFAMMELAPYSPLMSLAILVPSSLLYRAAVERFCRFRFTLPALVGGTALWVTKQAMITLVTKTALASVSTVFTAGIGMGVLAGYTVFVHYQSHADVEKRVRSLGKDCCS